MHMVLLFKSKQFSDVYAILDAFLVTLKKIIWMARIFFLSFRPTGKHHFISCYTVFLLSALVVVFWFWFLLLFYKNVEHFFLGCQ